VVNITAYVATLTHLDHHVMQNDQSCGAYWRGGFPTILKKPVSWIEIEFVY